jgi:hypothetical protein
MISSISKSAFISAILLFANLSFGQTTGAPRIYDVEFVKGVFDSSGAVHTHRRCPPYVPRGVCGNGNSKGYSLEGKKGDLITISVSSNTGGAVFSVFDQKGELLEAGSATTKWTGRLPADGYYRITVFTNKSYTPFKIRFSRSR